jgi:hypothetical protein
MVAETPPPAAGALVAVGSAQNAAAAKPSHDLEAIKQLATQTKAIGVIMPPPDIRAIVDKTAQFVAKNGAARRRRRAAVRRAPRQRRCSGAAAVATHARSGPWPPPLAPAPRRQRAAAAPGAARARQRRPQHAAARARRAAVQRPRPRARDPSPLPPSLPPGVEFERRILGQESQNVKFNFLQPTDPYHAFYRMRVRRAGSWRRA